MIVIVFGLPGSGKSYLAGPLALKLNARLISSDTVRRQIQPDVSYDEQAKTAVYLKMLALMEAAVKDHQNVVLDATFYTAALRKLFKEKAARLGQSIYFIEMRAAEERVKVRVSQKRPDSDADFNIYLKIKAGFEPLKEEHLVLYTDGGTLDQMLETATAYFIDPDHGTE